MKDINLDKSELIEELKMRFEAEIENEHPSEEELQFLRERDLLEEQVKGSFEKYTQNYVLLKSYGLETKLINELEWFIVFTLEHNREEFIKSPFYQQFKEHEVVNRAFLEYERKMEMKMNAIENIKLRQKKWAESKGIEIDDDFYVKTMSDNFIEKLSEESIRDLKGGDGSEIKDDKTRTKIFAIHSSSALVCNFFEYWRLRDKSGLSKAFGFSQDIKSLVYEQKLSMGMEGNMPNMDLFMILTNGQSVAVESKFTEWLNKKSKKQAFAESYTAKNRWSEVGLPNCQKLVERIIKNDETFFYLNAPQLLKHALGLANMHSNRSKLIYLYFDTDSTERKIHQEEIKKFKKALDGELHFTEITYQELYKKMKKSSKLNQEFLGELGSRYFQ